MERPNILTAYVYMVSFIVLFTVSYFLIVIMFLVPVENSKGEKVRFTHPIFVTSAGLAVEFIVVVLVA